MKQVVKFPNTDSIDEVAASWIAKLDAGKLSISDMKSLRAWAGQHKRHRTALEEQARSWDSLDALRAYRNVMEKPARRGRPVTAIAASIAALAVTLLVSLALLENSAPDLDYSATYSTPIGDQQQIDLPDGSVLQLNTRSVLQVAYTRETRAIHLLRGEAFFTVASMPERPFVVWVGNSSVTAVGTAFAVRREDTKVFEVTVTEGRVRIDPAPSTEVKNVISNPVIATSGQLARVEPVIATAGQQTRITPDSVATADQVHIDKKLAWRDGMLSFANDPLEDVIAEVARYSPVEIVISDVAIRQMKIGGYFPLGDTDRLIDTLVLNFGLHAEHVQDEVIYLSAAAPEPQ